MNQTAYKVLSPIRAKIDAATTSVYHRFDSLDERGATILRALKEERTSLPASLQLHGESLIREQHATYQLTHASLHESSKNIAEILQQLKKKHLFEALKKSDCPPDKHEIYEAVRRSLRYHGSNSRYTSVAEAHPMTFNWIFEDSKAHNRPWDDYMWWLQYGKGVYWITGKAASGKSTMVKLLAGHDYTHSALKKWSGDVRLVSLSFYFWGVGSVMQKSQAGLYRSLTLQILTAVPDILDLILPALCSQLASQERRLLEVLQISWYAWSLSELKELFETALNQASLSVKFCFFIDGLDEFDGDYNELITLFQSVSTKPNVKLCLASRPLLAFEEAFKGYPKLRLQDLNREDIARYSTDKLERHPKSALISSREPRLMERLVDDIVKMSSGVFLWVRLVVQSLLRGLTNSDDAADLHKRLHELPPELDDLFDHMLESIRPNFYVEQASRLLQIVYQAEEGISPLALSYADDDDDNLVFQAQIDELPELAKMKRLEAIDIRLKSRCLGLLEIDEQCV